MVDIKTIKDIPREDLLTGGTFACSGCPAILGTKFVLKALGKDTIIINASGCMTLTATHPFTPYKVPWVHGAIENAASLATGISMGLKAQKKKANIVCYIGDGATYDIGMQAISGAAHRDENLIVVCYNNSSFANTGYQKSSATPYGAITTTTPIGKKNPIGNILPRKHMAKILAAHGCKYVATASTSYPIDFMQKLQKASKINGFKFIDLLSPCIPGWLIGDDKGIEVGRAIVQSGIWPVYELENGKFRLNIKPQMLSVENVLKLQGRYKHLPKNVIKKIQEQINREWALLNKGNYWGAVEY